LFASKWAERQIHSKFEHLGNQVLSFRKRTKFPVFEQYLRKIREDFKDNDIDIDSDQVNWIPKIDGKILLQISY
jgi:hypothetical protein